jgi:hypothetical protein
MNATETTNAEYAIAFTTESNEFDIVETFEAGNDDAANDYAEQNYADQEWYVLRDGTNINS